MQTPAYLGNRYESDPCWYNICYLELPQESNDEVLTFPPGALCIFKLMKGALKLRWLRAHRKWKYLMAVTLVCAKVSVTLCKSKCYADNGKVQELFQ
jgi:hypothetical protein